MEQLLRGVLAPNGARNAWHVAVATQLAEQGLGPRVLAADTSSSQGLVCFEFARGRSLQSVWRELAAAAAAEGGGGDAARAYTQLVEDTGRFIAKLHGAKIRYNDAVCRPLPFNLQASAPFPLCLVLGRAPPACVAENVYVRTRGHTRAPRPSLNPRRRRRRRRATKGAALSWTPWRPVAAAWGRGRCES